jgi:hypothetical protein
MPLLTLKNICNMLFGNAAAITAMFLFRSDLEAKGIQGTAVFLIFGAIVVISSLAFYCIYYGKLKPELDYLAQIKARTRKIPTEKGSESAAPRKTLNMKEPFGLPLIKAVAFIELVYLAIFLGWYILIPVPNEITLNVIFLGWNMPNEIGLPSAKDIGLLILYIIHLPVLLFLVAVIMPTYAETLREAGMPNLARVIALIFGFMAFGVVFPLIGSLYAFGLLMLILLLPGHWPEDDTSLMNWLLHIYSYTFSLGKSGIRPT